MIPAICKVRTISSLRFGAGLATLILSASPAFSWEFSVKGEFNQRVGQLVRLSDSDLSRPAFVGNQGWDNVAKAGWSTNRPIDRAKLSDAESSGQPFRPNVDTDSDSFLRTAWRDSSSLGPEAEAGDPRLAFCPQFRMSKAIDIHGVYSLVGNQQKGKLSKEALAAVGSPDGEAEIPRPEPSRVVQRKPSSDHIQSTGKWERVKATVRLPVGTVSVETEKFPFGIGSTRGKDTGDHTTLVFLPYGQFRFLYASRLNRNRIAWNKGPASDTGTESSLLQKASMTYLTDNVGMGAATIWHRHREFLEGTYVPDRSFDGSLELDDQALINLLYLKLNGDDLFINGEFGWLNMERFLPAGVVSSNCRQHMEARHWFMEAGILVRSARLSVMYGLASSEGSANRNTPLAYLPLVTNFRSMGPIQGLPSNLYTRRRGSSNSASIEDLFSNDRMMNEAYMFGCRADYSMAANLYMWTSLMWGNQVERLRGLTMQSRETTGPELSLVELPGLIAADGFRQGSSDERGGSVMWEVNAGLDWKPLDAVTMNFRYALQRPRGLPACAYHSGQSATEADIPTPNPQPLDLANSLKWDLLLEF